MSNELKACPFCGEIPEMTINPTSFYKYGVKCLSQFCFEQDEDDENYHLTEQEAVEGWNTRPIEDALRAELEKVKGERDFLKGVIRRCLDSSNRKHRWVGHKCDAQVACDAITQRCIKALESEE